MAHICSVIVLALNAVMLLDKGCNTAVTCYVTPCSDDDEYNSNDESTPYTAVVSGPCWTVPLKPSELSDFVGMLNQLRSMVANLAAQGQWHGGTADRPASRVKV